MENPDVLARVLLFCSPRTRGALRATCRAIRGCPVARRGGSGRVAVVVLDVLLRNGAAAVDVCPVRGWFGRGATSVALHAELAVAADDARTFAWSILPGLFPLCTTLSATMTFLCRVCGSAPPRGIPTRAHLPNALVGVAVRVPLRPDGGDEWRPAVPMATDARLPFFLLCPGDDDGPGPLVILPGTACLDRQRLAVLAEEGAGRARLSVRLSSLVAPALWDGFRAALLGPSAARVAVLRLVDEGDGGAAAVASFLSSPERLAWVETALASVRTVRATLIGPGLCRGVGAALPPRFLSGTRLLCVTVTSRGGADDTGTTTTTGATTTLTGWVGYLFRDLLVAAPRLRAISADGWLPAGALALACRTTAGLRRRVWLELHTPDTEAPGLRDVLAHHRATSEGIRLRRLEVGVCLAPTIGPLVQRLLRARVRTLGDLRVVLADEALEARQPRRSLSSSPPWPGLPSLLRRLVPAAVDKEGEGHGKEAAADARRRADLSEERRLVLDLFAANPDLRAVRVETRCRVAVVTFVA